MPTHDERKSLKNEPLPDKQHLAEQGIAQPCMGQMPASIAVRMGKTLKPESE
jgi:hypothetical protein